MSDSNREWGANTDESIRSRNFRAAVLGRFSGIGAISPELYRDALNQLADRFGRTVDDDFRAEVTAIIKTLPCPLD